MIIINGSTRRSFDLVNCLFPYVHEMVSYYFVQFYDLAYQKQEKSICQKKTVSLPLYLCALCINTLIDIELTLDIIRFAIRKINFFSILDDVS